MAESLQSQRAAEEGADGLLPWVWPSICTTNELMTKAPGTFPGEPESPHPAKCPSQGNCGHRGLSWLEPGVGWGRTGKENE